MTRNLALRTALFLAMVPIGISSASADSGNFKLVGWNDLGMHCFDRKDYSVFGVLPPHNTIHAHLIDTGGSLVTSSSSYKVTLQRDRGSHDGHNQLNLRIEN